ncbi:MAG: radical SAM protein [Nitrospirae bacterium]|nr:radical SAM protein [Nitrospirota bacterium]
MSRRLINKVQSLLSLEKGTVYKDPGGKVNICLIYPNTYYVGMSNLGFQGIYGIMNKRQDVLCERAFLPDEEDMGEYIRTGTELFSLESRRSLSKFDILAFSVSFENDYPNVLKILSLARIPLYAKARNKTHPLVISGGICAFFNPEPLAPFMDMVFVGEGEEMLMEFIDYFREGHDREGLLKGAGKIGGIYVPRFYDVYYKDDRTIKERKAFDGAPEIIKKRWEKNIGGGIKTYVLSPDTEFSNMYLLEAQRGCPWSCRFCVTGFVYKPVRSKDIALLRAEVEEATAVTNRIGLIGPSLTDYRDIKEVLNITGVDFSITSLRASRGSGELVKLLRGHKSVSIAPEAGTERLRKVINKKITEEDILETACAILGSGIETLRLYFMLGLPTETMEDIEGISTIVKKIRQINKRGKINLSVSSFVPKPFTPFQWLPMEEVKSLKEKFKILRLMLREIQGVSVFHDVPKWAEMQGFLSRGDRRTAPVLEAISKGEDWKKAAGTAGIDINFYVYRQVPFDEILPWDFIDVGIKKETLVAECKSALSPRNRVATT